MTSSRRVAESLRRPALLGAILLAGCATAVSEQPDDDLSGSRSTGAYERMLIREYPKELLDAGIGGVTILELLLDEEGIVQEVSVRASSGHAALDEAALRIAPMVPFTRPVGHNGKPIGARITFPVRFDADEAMAADTCSRNVEPYYLNKRELQRALAFEYTAYFRNRGIGGQTIVWLLVDERGRVTKQQIKKISGYRKLDDAALRVSRQARFSPAKHCGEPVAVWVALPISFRAR